jgi:gas vesicle protein
MLEFIGGAAAGGVVVFVIALISRDRLERELKALEGKDLDRRLLAGKLCREVNSLKAKLEAAGVEIRTLEGNRRHDGQTGALRRKKVADELRRLVERLEA